MIVQFYIYSKTGNKLVYKAKRNGTYLRNNTVIEEKEYNDALSYFNKHRN